MAKQRGRTPKLTPEAREAILQAITDGVPKKQAAARAGVSPRTLRRWLARGREESKGEFASFVASFARAEAEAISQKVGIIHRAATGYEEVTVKTTVTPDGTRTETTTRRLFDWRAAAWLLERRYPELFGMDTATVKDLKRLLAELEARRAQSDAPPAEGQG